MIPPQLQAFLSHFVEQIFEEVFPNETGAARMQQIGLFTTILTMQPVTAQRIAEVSGQGHSQVHRSLQKLLKLGLVERTKVKNRLGKGQAWELSIKQTPQTQKLIDALMQGAKKAPR
jgi:predicted transcriptional regulator